MHNHAEGLENGSVEDHGDGLFGSVSFESGVPAVVAGLLAKTLGLLVEDVGDVGLGKKGEDGDKADSGEDCGF